jgi:hypothetical protein
LLQQKTVTAVREKEIKPIAEEMDERKKFNVSFWRICSDTVLFWIPYSKNYGGSSGLFGYAICMKRSPRSTPVRG